MSTSSRLWRETLGRWGDRLGIRRRSKGIKPPKSRSPRLEQFEERLLLSITPSILGPNEIDEGSLYTLQMSVATGEAVAQWTIDWGDGQSTTSEPVGSGSYPLAWTNGVTQTGDYAWTATHVYSDDQSITAVSATAYGDQTPTPDVGVAALGHGIVVHNVAPSIALSGGGDVAEGLVYTVTITVDDPGNDKIESWTIAWGDEDGEEPLTIERPGDSYPLYWGDGITRIDANTWQARHKYAADGSYTVTATAADEDGTWNAYSASGTLDTRFGQNGWAVQDFGLVNDSYGMAMLVQPDGKILVAGYGNGDFLLVRYNPDGTLDTGFGASDGVGGRRGYVVTNVGGSDVCNALAMQSDGKILLAGYSGSDVALVRYTADGQLDNDSEAGFGADHSGKVIQSFSAGSDRAYCVTVLPDDSIVIGGWTETGTPYVVPDQYDALFARFTADGVLDTGFANPGHLSPPPGRLAFSSTTQYTATGNVYDCAYAIEVLWRRDDPDEVVLVAAGEYHANHGLFFFNDSGEALAAYGGGDGVVEQHIGGGGDAAYDLAIDRGQSDAELDDTIILCGYAYGATANFTVARFTDDGALDMTFDVDGLTTLDFDGGLDHARSVAILPDGRIVAGGLTTTGTSAPYNFALSCRDWSGGGLDAGFGVNGLAKIDYAGGADRIQSVAIDEDGNILLAGYVSTGGHYRLALARVLSPLSGHLVTVHPLVTTGTISGTVFDDVDQDGIYDLGEEPLGGQPTVSLQRVDTDAELLQSLLEPERWADEAFGRHVAACGENVLITSGAGSSQVVHLFEAATGLLVRTFTDPVAGGSFGNDVVAAGGRIYIADPYEDVSGQVDAGAVYVFDAQTGDSLGQFIRRNPTTGALAPTAYDLFGTSLAVLDGNLVVGVPSDDFGGTNKGAVHLLDGQTGANLRTFVRTEPDPDENFGWVVAADAGRVVVGSLGDALGMGAAYVFDAAAGSEVAVFENPSTSTWANQFGSNVAILGDKVLVGAPGEYTTSAFAGAVYLYDLATNQYELIANPSLDASWESDQFFWFGSSLGVHGDGFLVAARDQDALCRLDVTTGECSLFYEVPEGGWDLSTKGSFAPVGEGIVVGLPATKRDEWYSVGAACLVNAAGEVVGVFENPAEEADTCFGQSVAALGSSVVVGAPRADGLYGVFDDTGTVYILDSATGEVELSIENPAIGGTPTPYRDWFGSCVTTWNGNIVVGASRADRYIGGTLFTDVGAVHVFSASGSLRYTIDNLQNPNSGDYFGVSLAVQGDYLLVGAYEDSAAGYSGLGAVYVYRLQESGAVFLQRIHNPADVAGIHFGQSVAWIGNDLLVSAPFGSSLGAVSTAGVVCRFAFDELTQTWNPVPSETYQKPFPSQWDHFGYSLAAIDGDILIGAPGDSTIGDSVGAAYLFDGEDGDWLRTFLPPAPTALSGVGLTAVAAGHDRVLLASSQGPAYLFDATTGALLQTFSNPRGAEMEFFGFSAAAIGEACEAIALGAAYDDQAAADAGAVYLFDTGYREVRADANGNYAFTGLLPGKYLVRQVPAAGRVGSCPADPRGYTITLGVTERGLVGSEAFVDFGSYGSAAGPSVIVRGDDSVDEGDLYAIEVSAVGIDVDHWLVDWGDGTAEEEFAGFLPILTHTYASSTLGQSSHAISVTAVDGADVEYAAAEAPTVAVNPAAPTLSALPDLVVRPGTEFTFEALFTDPCLTGGSYDYAIEWGDGSDPSSGDVAITGTSGSFSEAHTYGTLNAEGYTVRVTVYDPLYLASDDSRKLLRDVEEFKVVVAEMGPAVTEASPSRVLLGPVGQVSITFDRAINSGTFNSSDVTLAGPGGAIGTSVGGSGSSYAVTFASQSAAGVYTLVIGPNIEDNDGRLMNQDGDAVNGESSDAYTFTFEILDPPDRQYEVAEDGVLVVAASNGLLIEDGLALPAGWTATLTSVPTNGDLYPVAFGTNGQPVFADPLEEEALISAGAFLYRPDGDYCGEDSFTYTLTDSLQHTSTVTVTIAVRPDSLVVESLDAGTGTWTVVVGDEDSPTYVWPNDSLSFSLDPGCPSGATIDTDGVIHWSDPQAAGTFLFTVRVSDDGTPALSDVKTFQVSVGSANAAPEWSSTNGLPDANQVVYEHDDPYQENETLQVELNVLGYLTGSITGLAYRLGPDAPRGAAINPSTGAFSWDPTDDQDGVFPITIEVIRPGNPPMMISDTFTVTVVEVDDSPGAPSLALANNTGTSPTDSYMAQSPIPKSGGHCYQGSITRQGSPSRLGTSAGEPYNVRRARARTARRGVYPCARYTKATERTRRNETHGTTQASLPGRFGESIRRPGALIAAPWTPG